MIQIFKTVNVDWLAHRRILIAVSIGLLLLGLASALVRELTPGGTGAFNLGVDFSSGTVITAKFKQRPSDEAIRNALTQADIRDFVVQPVTSKSDEVLIKVAQDNSGEEATASIEEEQSQVNSGRTKVVQALATFGDQAGAEIVGTEAVGPVAGRQLRNQAVAVTLLALVGILAYIAFRFELAYGAAAVIAVFHDVLVTLGFFSIFQWEISLTVIVALITLVGFSVNDTIVIFDRVRENLRSRRRDTLYDLTNNSINQTLSRTVITSGTVFLSVLALVLFGGEVLRGFSLALFVGIICGTYSTIAVASPIMVWWQQKLEANRGSSVASASSSASAASRAAGKPARGGATKTTKKNSSTDERRDSVRA